MHFLITRPIDRAEGLARRLEALGHRATVAAVLEVVAEGAGPIDPGNAQAVIFTSVNGVSMGVPRLNRTDLPVFAVGDKTADAAREAGLGEVTSAGGDAGDLAALIGGRLAPADGPLLHLKGAQGGLAVAGFTLKVETVYRVASLPALPDRAAGALRSKKVDAVPLFSPRSATTFVSLVTAQGLAEALGRVTALCLSEAVAEAAAGPVEWGDVKVAKRPNARALFEAVGIELQEV